MYKRMAPRPSVLLLLDFDDTITARDSLSTIAPPAGTQVAGPDFAHYSELYFKDFANYTANYGPRESLAEQFRYLEGMEELEVENLGRIVRLDRTAGSYD